MVSLDDRILSASYGVRDVVEGSAATRSRRLPPDSNLGFAAEEAALWRGIGAPAGGIQGSLRARDALPRDSALCLAFTTSSPCRVSGEAEVEHTADLRPGLRCSMLIDDRVVGAPMVQAAPWEGVGVAITGPAPELSGRAPSGTVAIEESYLPPGQHWLWIAAPHDRDAGRIGRVTLRSGPMVTPPSVSFAMISDVHLTRGSTSEWMNLKMGPWSERVLRDSLSSLRSEGVSLFLFGGDLTDQGSEEQFQDFGRICEALDSPAFACLGNHDLLDRDTAARSIRGALGGLFPGGASSYRAPLEHLDLHVLDSGDGISAMAATTGPQTGSRLSVVLRHYPVRNRGGVSSAGFKLPDWSSRPRELETLPADRGRLFLAGHCHWTECMRDGGDWYLQNPAFCEWPNAYRVCHLFERSLDWELRQVRNRAFVTHSFIPRKRVSWMLSTVPHDLCGSMPLSG